ncbi:hypothetical protein SLS62_007889 [Diatrype stigma]|uniref:Uncharacterized protein n=1 Tax=Diatrype stigma TaxID=117547 RepID=A0AAN9YQA5_9PEZI
MSGLSRKMDAARLSSDSLSPTLVNEDTGETESIGSPESNHDTEIGEDDEDFMYSSDSDDGEEPTETQKRHEDHWDLITFRNPWTDEWSADWQNNWIRRGKESLTNEELYENTTTQQWMKALGSIQHRCISLLMIPRGSDGCTIPLFEGGNGWQYQVRLAIGGHPLPRIRCPSVLTDQQLMAESLFQLERCIQTEPGPSAERAPTLPKLAAPLGRLWVRNNARYPDYFRTAEPVTEYTDYFVVVDVEHEDMPLWILAPRAQLQKRLDNASYPGTPVLPLPIFGGLMSKEDDSGYDCACIIPSLRSLGRRPPDPDATSFQDACELVRKTRAVIDPAALLLPEERVSEFMGGVSLPNTCVLQPYSELGSTQEQQARTSAQGQLD